MKRRESDKWDDLKITEENLADDALFAEFLSSRKKRIGEAAKRMDSVEDLAMGLHALKILSGKSDEEFREINGRFGKELGELLDRGDPPTPETWREIREVIERFFEALGRPPTQE
jgi:predicted glycoside hydrolase/deacetylase ChbG (UPF0249 family)